MNLPFQRPVPLPRRVRLVGRLRRLVGALLQFPGRLLDAEDRAALADLAMLYVLVAITVLLSAVVLGESIHLLRLLGGL